MLLRLFLVFAILQAPSLCAQASAPVPPAKPAAQTAVSAPGDASVFNQPPPDVDAALRERLNAFYKCYVDGKFRVAYEMVADDSKDAFFDAQKSRYKDFKILRVDYSDNFTKAKVMVGAKVAFTIQGTVVPATMPILQHWKYENGNWFWYVIPRTPGDVVMTPFGPMQVQPKDPNAKAASKASPGTIDSPAKAVASFYATPRLVSSVVTLTAANKYKNYLELMNPSKGSFTLEFSTDAMPGLTLTPASQVVAPGKTGVIVVTLADEQAKAIRKAMLHNVTVTTTGSSKLVLHAAVQIVPQPAKP